MNIHDYISCEIERQGRTKAWMAEQCNINYKTFIDKLSRGSIGAMELLKISKILNIDLNEIKTKISLNSDQLFSVLEYRNDFQRLGINEWTGKMSISEIYKLYLEGILIRSSDTNDFDIKVVVGKKIKVPKAPSVDLCELANLIKNNNINEHVCFNIKNNYGQKVYFEDSTNTLKIICSNISVIKGFDVIRAIGLLYTLEKDTDPFILIDTKITHY